MFGVPIVLNPIMIFPFIFVPIINILVVYAVMKAGLVGIPVGINPSWTMPIGFSGAIATNWDLRAVVLQFLVLALDIVLYYPFFKSLDNKQLKEETALENSKQASILSD